MTSEETINAMQTVPISVFHMDAVLSLDKGSPLNYEWGFLAFRGNDRAAGKTIPEAVHNLLKKLEIK